MFEFYGVPAKAAHCEAPSHWRPNRVGVSWQGPLVDRASTLDLPPVSTTPSKGKTSKRIIRIAFGFFSVVAFYSDDSDSLPP